MGSLHIHVISVLAKGTENLRVSTEGILGNIFGKLMISGPLRVLGAEKTKGGRSHALYVTKGLVARLHVPHSFWDSLCYIVQT